MLLIFVFFIILITWNPNFTGLLFLGWGTGEWFSRRFYLSLERYIFFILLFVVFFTIGGFRKFYIGDSSRYLYFILLIFLFTLRIFFFSLVKSPTLLFLFWDMLGITSFLLVNFFNNWERVNRAINTVLSNRVGDYFLLGGASVYLLRRGFVYSLSSVVFFGLFILIASFTKRAQWPFSGWLPKAIAAPTPVSSLVHRRTLVTAGRFLLFKFWCFIKISFLLRLIMMVGVFTIFLARISAILEEDVKKVVALSTLSQIGLIYIGIGVGIPSLSYLHLIRHGFFKSLLFIQWGIFIFISRRQQDRRGFAFFGGSVLSSVYFMKLCVLNLRAVFFRRGILTKDLLVEALRGVFFFPFIYFRFLFSIGLTLFYRIKFLILNSMRFLPTVSSFPINSNLYFIFLPLSRGTLFHLIWWNRNYLISPSFFLRWELFALLIMLGVFIYRGLKFYFIFFSWVRTLFGRDSSLLMLRKILFRNLYIRNRLWSLQFFFLRIVISVRKRKAFRGVSSLWFVLLLVIFLCIW